jgi:L-ascorbate metabolism protein UlaG (beta-lactamase superfamily)
MHKKQLVALAWALVMTLGAQGGFETDTFPAGGGVLRITFIGHASLLFRLSSPAAPKEFAVYVDPDGRQADFSQLPKADLILVTHGHGDHFDPQAIAALRQPSTRLLVAPVCLPLPDGAATLKNGEKAAVAGIEIEAVPAYNIVHKRGNGSPFHPRGEGNGYVLGFPGCRVYVAGDTEDIPEMAQLHDVDVAFLPMNLPYTMTPEMAAAAAKMVKPRVLYPYHFSNSDPQRLVELLQGIAGLDVRVRRLQ